MHPSLITLHSARDDPSGGRCPAQIPQLDTPQASKESHNSIHNHSDTDVTGCNGCQRAGALRMASSSCQCDSSAPVAWSPSVTRPSGSLVPRRPSLSTSSSMLTPASDTSRPLAVSRPCRLNTSASFHDGFDVDFFVDVRFFFSFLPPQVISTLTNGSVNRRRASRIQTA